jgi:Ser/Thr protein kinase RdoA (MazF antagonist)
MNTPALGRLLGSGKEAEVFESGTFVLKLYRAAAAKRSAFREAANLALAESLGLPAPSVLAVFEIDDRWGIMMTRADGPSFGEAVSRQPDLAPQYLEAMARLHVRVHGHPGAPFAGLKTRLAANIRKVEILGEARRNALLKALAAMPEGDSLCHGDFHPWNIMGPPDRATLIDWLDAYRGDPAADVCRAYALIRPTHPDLASAYVDAYCALSGQKRDRIMRWLPFVAAARLAEGAPHLEDALTAMIDAHR